MKIDKSVNDMLKRLEGIIVNTNSNSTTSTAGSGPNWDMINAAIAEHDGDPWYIPKEGVYNAWTCLVYATLGNISLRDFALERKFFNMRHERVQEYKRKWEEARDKGDKEYLSTHIDFGMANTLYQDWTKEEIDYYSDVERYPFLKEKLKQEEGYYFHPWDKRNPQWQRIEEFRLFFNKLNNK